MNIFLFLIIAVLKSNKFKLIWVVELVCFMRLSVYG